MHVAARPAEHATASGRFTDPTANATTAYLYRVVAQNTVGYGAAFPSMTVQSVSAGGGRQSSRRAPTNLVATLQAGPQVSLTWRDNATNETGFVIERSVNGGAFTQIATAPARNSTGNVTYVDTTAVATSAVTTYTYRVAAVNIAGTSAYSNERGGVRARPAGGADQLHRGQRPESATTAQRDPQLDRQLEQRDRFHDPAGRRTQRSPATASRQSMSPRTRRRLL